jgi:phosphatidate cytidylyltransferase
MTTFPLLVAVDRAAVVVVAVVAGVLALATVAGLVLRARTRTDAGRRTVANLNARTRAWWVMVALLGAALWAGHGATIFLFAVISFLALREMITLTPSRRADHHTLFWAFFVMVPLQYYLVYAGRYGLYSIVLPVYGFLFLALRSTFTGDYTNYLERTAKIQWGVMICVYCLSHAPAITTLPFRNFGPGGWRMLVFLVGVVQMSDVLQYVWGKLLGKRKIAPHISPNKTWEGFVGGVLAAAALGAAAWKLTPFTPLQAFGMALTIALLGFAGGIVMSAVKRDAGVKDYGHLIEGHGGMMDRVDSLSFAAPVFFHVCRFWFG